MRRLLLTVLAIAVATPVVTVLPVVLRARSPHPRPVGAQIENRALRGVDDAALRSGPGAASGLAAESAWAEAAAWSPASPRRGRTAGGGFPGAIHPGLGDPAVFTAVLHARRSFQTVGVTWNAGAGVGPDLTVVLRTRDRQGWTPWQPLEIADGADRAEGGGGSNGAAGAAGTRGGTEPAWVGPSDAAQVRVDVGSGLLPSGLRLVLIDPGASDYDRVAGQAPPDSAAAAASRPQILSRRAWGANETEVKNPPTYLPTIVAGVLHHTADRNNYTAAQVPAIIRGDYAYHLSRGWNDIGYNFLVDRFGRIWEGRRGGVTLAVQGAHTGGFNTDTFGVATIGNYEEVRPSAAMVNSVARLFAWKLDLYHRNPRGVVRLTSAGGGTSRYPAGTSVTKPVIMGHRDVGRTACPGRYLYRLLGTIRAKVAVLMAAALLDPSGPAPTATPGAGASISARALAAQSWRLDVADRCRGGTVATRSGTVAAGARFTATWNGRGPGSAVSRPGGYTLRLSSRSRAGTARPVSGQVAVLPPAPPPVASGALTSGPGGYVPVPPRRLLDTRSGPLLPAGPAGRVDVAVLGRAGVPASGVTSVVLQVTALCPTASTAIQVWPAGQPRGRATTLNLRPGQGRGALVEVAVGAAGKVSIGNASGVTDVLVDVLGYHAAGTGAAFRPVSRTRVYTTGTAPGAAVPDGEDRQITVPGLGGVPANQIVAVVADLTVIRPARAGALTAYPAGVAFPRTSTVRFEAGATVDVRSVIALRSGQFVLHASGTAVTVTVDVTGVYVAAPAAGADFTALPGARLLDTRPTHAPLLAGQQRDLVVAGVDGVPVNASAVVVNLEALSPTAATLIIGWPAGQSAPGGADLRVAAGDVRANLAVIPVGAGGGVSLRSSAGSTHLIVDLVGYFD